MLPFRADAKGAATSRTVIECQLMGGHGKQAPTSARSAESPSSALPLLPVTRMLMMTEARDAARAKQVRPHLMDG
jgi:hypothetical protein